MKSDHRHDLKTNELAEWLINFPQWTKDNLITIICVLGLIVAAAGVCFWKFYGKEWDEYKWTMPGTRFLLYVDKMNKANEEMNKSKQARNVDKLKDTMPDEERKRYEEEYG